MLACLPMPLLQPDTLLASAELLHPAAGSCVAMASCRPRTLLFRLPSCHSLELLSCCSCTLCVAAMHQLRKLRG